jgi:hypothetical protein
MNKKFYLIVISGGVEIDHRGPFESELIRDTEAKALWIYMNPANSDNIFKLNTDEDGRITTGVYVGEELEG